MWAIPKGLSFNHLECFQAVYALYKQADFLIISIYMDKTKAKEGLYILWNLIS